MQLIDRSDMNGTLNEREQSHNLLFTVCVCVVRGANGDLIEPVQEQHVSCLADRSRGGGVSEIGSQQQLPALYVQLGGDRRKPSSVPHDACRCVSVS